MPLRWGAEHELDGSARVPVASRPMDGAPLGQMIGSAAVALAPLGQDTPPAQFRQWRGP